MSFLESTFHFRSLFVIGVMPLLVPMPAALVVAGLALAVFALTTLDDDRARQRRDNPARSAATELDELTSTDERVVLAAIDSLAQRGERVPALVLYHPSPVVVRHALAAIGPQRDVQPYLRARREPAVR